MVVLFLKDVWFVFQNQKRVSIRAAYETMLSFGPSRFSTSEREFR